MGVLFAYGIELILGAAIFIICTIIGLFIGHIILFDSIALGILSGVCSYHFLSLHSALCLLIGAAVFAGLLLLQKTPVGFWVIGILLSVVWAVIFGLLAFILSNADQLWFYVVAGIAFVDMIILHIRARENT